MLTLIAVLKTTSDRAIMIPWYTYQEEMRGLSLTLSQWVILEVIGFEYRQNLS